MGSMVCCIVAIGVVEPSLSHGFGEPRYSAGADSGVGSVELVITVVADIGVVAETELEAGVNGVRIFGDSSVRVNRIVGSCCVSLDLSRLNESCRASLGIGPLCVGIVKGARSFGESGCFRAEVDFCTFLILKSSRLSSGHSFTEVVVNSKT